MTYQILFNCMLSSVLYLICWDFVLLFFSLWPPKNIEKDFQPNENSHILPEHLYLLFSNKFKKQISSTEGFDVWGDFWWFHFFHFLISISTLYSVDLMCTYFYSSPHSCLYSSLYVCFFIYFKVLNFALFTSKTLCPCHLFHLMSSWSIFIPFIYK